MITATKPLEAGGERSEHTMQAITPLPRLVHNQIRERMPQIMFRLNVAILVGLMLVLMTGCTTASINYQTGDARYISILQQKSLSYARDPATGIIRLDYSTNSNPAVDTFQKAFELGFAYAERQNSIAKGIPLH